MELIFDPKEPLKFPISTGIGNFDGVHLGHKKIIEALKKTEDIETKTSIITFNPHPQTVVNQRNISLIYPLDKRFKLLESRGIDCVICLSFTKELSNYSAEDFVSKILVDLLRVKNIAVGPGFIFGNKRSGDIDLLKSLGNKLGFNTIIVEPGKIGDDIVSSTKVREFIENGEISKANIFLGNDYFIQGTVVEGEKRGREIGFPTINLDSDWEMLPKTGVYATYVYIEDDLYKSITNIGYRPTFGDDKLLIETHIFGFKGDLYGKEVKVNFAKRLRDEKKFDSVDSLVSQIKIDVSQVKKILSDYLKG